MATMRAVVAERYGGPEDLQLVELPIPEPGRGQVLVEVVATSLNLSDWESLRGSPAYARIGGLRAPARSILGSDIAGRVAAVGPEVIGVSVGDAVYADNLGLKGGFAEFALVPASAIAPKPPALSFIDASTIPQAGPIAWQGIVGAAPGRRVLINGGGGGSGMFAIQLAKQAGAHVTAVDVAAKLDHMRALGADDVIDHRTEDFARREPFDVMLDLVARRSVFTYRRSLARGGRYRVVGGTTRALLRVVTLGALIGRLSGRRLGVLAVRPGPDRFAPVAEQVVAGELAVHVDRVVSLADVPAAMAALGAGEILGKAVVALD